GEGDELLATVVAVLSQLRDEDTGATTLLLLEGVSQGDGALDVGHLTLLSYLVLVHTGQCLDLGLVTSEDLLQRIGDLTDGGLGTSGVDSELEQVLLQIARLLVVVAGRGGQRVQCTAGLVLVALGTQTGQLLQLLDAHLAVVHLEDRKSVV